MLPTVFANKLACINTKVFIVVLFPAKQPAIRISVWYLTLPYVAGSVISLDNLAGSSSLHCLLIKSDKYRLFSHTTCAIQFGYGFASEVSCRFSPGS